MGKYKTHIEVKDRKIRINHRWRTLEDIPTETLIQYKNQQQDWIMVISSLALDKTVKEFMIDETKQIIRGLDIEIELRKRESQGESNF